MTYNVFGGTLNLALSIYLAYTEDAAELFDKHDLGYHMFADDKQLYMHVFPGHEVVVYTSWRPASLNFGRGVFLAVSS